MSRLIIVSNRVPIKDSQGALPAGGLGTALHAALEVNGGLWMGWSGKEIATPKRPTTLSEEYPLTKIQQGAIEYLLMDLPHQDVAHYYLGFSNQVLWPLCHYHINLIDYKQNDVLRYFHVNRIFAKRLYPFIKPDDILWIHDYHLIPLASELRQLGIKNRIGFFMHIPWPSSDVLFTIPIYDILLRAMVSYDLIGFQTENDLLNFTAALTRSGIGKKIKDDLYQSGHWQFKANVFPISIETSAFKEQPLSSQQEQILKRFYKSLNNRDLIIGVDRLDYSKGILQRMQAYEQFIRSNLGSHGKVTFLQITPKSRSAVPEYASMQKNIAELAGQINGHYGQIDWAPIRYVNQSLSQNILIKLYRYARIGLVTPLRDGMNLVAKEYVAAQNPEDPGVLILSRFAGAAKELKGALLVNPYDRDAVANAISTGLSMRLKERQKRWEPMFTHLTTHSIEEWTQNFLKILKN